MASTMQQPVVYADSGSPMVASQYVSYPLPSQYTTGTYKGASPDTAYTTSYIETRPQLKGDPTDSIAHISAARQRVHTVDPVTGNFTFDSKAEELPVTYYTTSAGARVPKFVTSDYAQPLKVPEAGTQSRGKFKAEFSPPRATTSPATGAAKDSLASYQHEWQQENKQLQMMLAARENQLEEKEQELQETTMKLQELRKQGGTSSRTTEKGGDGTASQDQEAELKTMRKRVELLRRERQDLVELLLQKEKQVAVLDTVDHNAKEASAIQLGVQAITMVQEASELREKLQLAEAEIKTLRAERAAADELQQDTFDKLTDKRREAAELLELLSQRDMKVARVEAYLQQKTRELEFLAARARERLQKEQHKREEVMQEYLVAKEQCNAFKATVASRDEKLLQTQAEVVRRDTMLKQLEDRVRVLSDDLMVAHSQLQQMLRGMAAKDAYMQELEAQLRKSDTERQVAYLTEVSKSRKLALDTRIQQDQCRAALNDKQEKLAAAKQDLLRNQEALEKIRKAIGNASDVVEPCFTRSEALQSPAPHIHSHVAEPLSLPSNSASDIPSIPIRQSLRSLDADFLVRHPPAPAPVIESTKPPPAESKPLLSSSKLPPSPSKPLSAQATSVTGSGFLRHEYYPPYTAVGGDLVDQAMARLFDKPEYRQFAAHFCRLGPDTYLCCMNEVTMFLEKEGNVVMRLPGGEKIALASYLELLRSGSDICPKLMETGMSVPTKAACQPGQKRVEQS